MFGSFKDLILKFPWGANCMIALYWSLFSGVVVALQYDPATPYYSTNSLDIIVPFGKFWRSLHFYSSQAFFLLSVAHLAVVIINKTHLKISTRNWLLLMISLATTLLILFTGYILRGDATGSFAGTIAENILLSIPFVGKSFNYILFSISETGMKRVYANHVVSLGLLWIFLSWNHIRFYKIPLHRLGWFSIGLVLYCVWINAPMEPEKLGEFMVNGPWFFLGLQEGLRYVQPIWAGVVFPSSLIAALFFLNRGGAVEKRFTSFVGLWLVAYCIMSLAALY